MQEAASLDAVGFEPKRDVEAFEVVLLIADDRRREGPILEHRHGIDVRDELRCRAGKAGESALSDLFWLSATSQVLSGSALVRASRTLRTLGVSRLR